MEEKFFACEGDKVERNLLLCSKAIAQKYPASSRLKRRSDFSRLSRFGRRFSCGPISFQYSIISEQEASRKGVNSARLGITVVRKQGCSVERNLFKRRVREVFRRSPIHLRSNIDLNVRLKDRLPISYQEIEIAFAHFEEALSPRS